MRLRTACLILVIVFSIAAIISIVHSSKLKALKIMKYAVKNLKKIKKLTPVLLLIRKKPIIIVVKKNCNHSPFPDLGLGGDAFAASQLWSPLLSETNFPYPEVHL